MRHQEISNNIAKILQAQDRSQRDLARHIGMEEASLSRIINGHSHPSARTMLNIAKGLDCTVEEVFSLSDGAAA